MATGSPTDPCWKISATRKDSTTTLMKRPSRSTVPRLTESSRSAFALTVSAGFDSGSLRKTRIAQAIVIPASIRNPAR